MVRDGFVEVSKDFFVAGDYVDALVEAGLDSMDAVFAFEGGEDLGKANLGKHRRRIRFELEATGKRYYLKRYEGTPLGVQVRNWIDHWRRASMSSFDMGPGEELAALGIRTPKVVAYGDEWEGVFEGRSFLITEEISDAKSLEESLPSYFYDSSPVENVDKKRAFIERLADFAKYFHQTGYRHRDFYLCHIFMTADEEFYLIDLHRTFKPVLFDGRFRVKDIAQLYYSVPGDIISRADRLRFYRRYVGRDRLTVADKIFIRQLKSRAWRMADHDIKHGREVPFAK